MLQRFCCADRADPNTLRPPPSQGLCSVSVGVTSLVPGVYALVTTPVTSAPGTNVTANAVTDPREAAARQPTRLVEGQTSLAAVSAGGWQYFATPLRNVAAGSTYWASVVELTGTTRVWALSNGSFPTPTSFTQSPPAVMGVQLVTYAPGSAGYSAGQPGAALVVGVYGNSGAVFTITFGASSTVVELLVSPARVLRGSAFATLALPAPPCSPASRSPPPSPAASTRTTRCASATSRRPAS